ncbi:hypothetical protein HQ590_02030, partial [bacterium]|nr:hypothetical protein [bacterium]
MMMTTRSTARLAVAALAAWLLTPLLASAGWWTPPAPASNSVAGLERIFGGTAAGWKIAQGNFAVAREADLDADVLTAVAPHGLLLQGQTQYGGAYEIRARVRLRTDVAVNAGLYLYAAQTNAADQGYYIALGASRGNEYINITVQDHGRPLHDTTALGKTMDWTPSFSSSMLYYLKAYTRILPGWEESYRQQIESAMARLPDPDHKWIDLRVRLQPGLIRVWVDDRLIATKPDPKVGPDGVLKLHLSPGVQLAAFAVTPPADTPGFVPIRLAGYANARALLGTAGVAADSLPPAGQVAAVGDVPFEFPGVNAEGNDHLDLGQSLLRQANVKGYVPAGPGLNGRWLGASVRDPARIQVRLANGRYDALHLVAAADGDAPSVPVVSAMFYRPGAGYPETFTTRVPLATARST